MTSLAATSETSVGEIASNGDVTLILPSIVFELSADDGFVLRNDYVAHLPVIDFTTDLYAVNPTPDVWLSFPVVNFDLAIHPPTMAPGIALRFPTVSFDLATHDPRVSIGAAVHLPTVTFTLEAPAPSIAGPIVTLPVLNFVLSYPQVKLTEGATVDLNVVRFVVTGTATSEAATSEAGPLQEVRVQNNPDFELFVFPITVGIGTAIRLPTVPFTLSADPIEAISRPGPIRYLAIAS